MFDRNTKRFFRHTFQQVLKGKYGKSFAILGFILLIFLSFFAPVDLFDEPTSNARAKKGEYFEACRVTKLVDGDTVHALCPLTDNNPKETIELKIRVYGIDAPEMKQEPWGKMAKEYLHSQLNYQNMAVRVMDIDRYQRYVAKIYNGEQDLGLSLVENGYAIVYDRYNDDPQYKELEAMAKKAKIGIWSKKGHHQNPEKWRKLN